MGASNLDQVDGQRGGDLKQRSERLTTLPEDWDRALAIVAHPDDLEYGAAAAVARWTSQMKSVSYALVTSGEAGIDSMTPEEARPLREQEERLGAAAVGVEDVQFLGHRDGVLEHTLELRRDIARVIRRSRPEILVTMNHHPTWPHGGFNMADHRVVGLAALDAARDAANRWVFTDLLEEGLEPWNGTRMVCVNASPHPTHVVDVSGFVEQGVASLEAHAAYINGLSGAFDARGFLESNLGSAGRRANLDYGVDFEVIEL